MSVTDEENLVLAQSQDFVDQLNSKFYGRFPYPWRPMEFGYLLNPDFWTIMINQDLGDWRHEAIAKTPRIWVAGCGTNQAVYTALKFPKASVLGSDLSVESLKLCAQTARELGVSNLELLNESINQITHTQRFDYIICTGVIHHNADPGATLSKLSAALKPSGILELMVYNRYHRVATSAFQKAIRLMSRSSSPEGFETELSLAQWMIKGLPVTNLISGLLNEYSDSPETALADALLQPVEHSYTVESLTKLAADCDLDVIAPCINIYDRAKKLLSWNMEFKDSRLQQRYDSLPDSTRWQITNLLLFEKSPLLWFYFQRKDSGRQRKSERQVCEEFLATSFERAITAQKSFVIGEDGVYCLIPGSHPFPTALPDPSLSRVIDLCDGKTRMQEIFERLEMDTTFEVVNLVRLKLTTSAFPYLKAVNSDLNGGGDSQDKAALARKLKEAASQRFRNVRRHSS